MRKALSTRGHVIALLALAVILRAHGINWDGGIGAHPDERYIVDVASQLSLPGHLNPFDTAPTFAYGHVPLYLLALLEQLFPRVDPLLLGRGLSAAFDVGTVGLTYVLGRRMRNAWVGLVAAACVGLMVAHVQQAHFYTPDTLLAFLVMAALVLAVRYAQEGHPRDVWLAGSAAGLAVGTKATGVLLTVPLGVALSCHQRGRGKAILGCGLAALTSFVAVSPAAMTDLSTYVGNLSRQAAIVRGAVDVPYTRQYHGTLPYLYPLVQQLRWGMGWTAGLCALTGMVYTLFRGVRRGLPQDDWVLLSWAFPFFGCVGGLYAKFPRYLLPLLPIWALYAAALALAVERRYEQWGRCLTGVLLASLMVRCVALAAMYRAPHPWAVASDWIRSEVEEGVVIAVEAWDQPLPVDAEGYELVELPIFDEETDTKWELMDTELERADYVVVASRRGYAALGRWPARYGRTGEYYNDLFEGRLGFQLAACFGRYPRLGPLVIADDPTRGLSFSLPEGCGLKRGIRVPLGLLDESFVVYDHPQVLIFRARAALRGGLPMV